MDITQIEQEFSAGRAVNHRVVRELITEVKRLRAALEQIAAGKTYYSPKYLAKYILDGYSLSGLENRKAKSGLETGDECKLCEGTIVSLYDDDGNEIGICCLNCDFDEEF